MANLVLYRKYRPTVFSDVVGQQHIIQTLMNAVNNDLLAHCYLFSGPKGTGKTTIARLLAKRVNCENPKNGEPCDKCSSCLEIGSGRAIDLIEIDAASNRGIDDIRELKEGIKFAPSKLKYKVFIIDESHQLSKDAANALLKILEEPPHFAVFILATTEAHKMISTISSRCQRFDFKKISAQDIIKKLDKIIKTEKLKIDKDAIELIAMNSDGAMRNAEVLLDQVISFSHDNEKITAEDIKQLLGIVDISLISEFVGKLFEKKNGKTIEFLHEILEKGMDPQELAKATVDYLRIFLLFKISGDVQSPMFNNLTNELKDNLEKQAKDIQENDIRKALRTFLEAQNKVRYSSIPQLPIELAILEISGD